MIWLLRLFPAFRELVNLSQSQAEALESEVREHEEAKRNLSTAIVQLESERSRRIAAESIASERREEIIRILDQTKDYQRQLEYITTERIKSLDNLNVKLMEVKAPEPTPDITQFRAVDKLKTQMVQQIRDSHNAIDMAVLSKLHPKFKPRIVMNETPKEEEPAA